MVSAWSSGTGGAGLLGALLFLALTSWVGMSIPYTLGVVALFPVMMLIAYFIILTSPPPESSRYSSAGYRPISSSSQIYTGASDADDEELLSPRNALRHRSSFSSLRPSISSVNRGGGHSRNGSTNTDHRTMSINSNQDNSNPDNSSLSILTAVPTTNGSAFTTSPSTALPSAPWDASQWSVPAPQDHMEPTSINTLLAATDPDDPEFVSPFRECEVGGGDSTRRRVYKIQPNEAMTLDEKLAMAKSLLLGVFISRSSASLVQIRHLWIPSLLQVCTLLVATAQALLTTPESSPNSFPYPLPSIYLVFALIFWEGLLGGATYVHTYIGISKGLEHDPKGKEFALGVVGVADALGILVAGLASLWIEPALCEWQVVERGVSLCLAMAD
ncbi:battenin CLN3 protein [Mortierella sp. AD094]|nr:battenin CLN3 protein [Mortierella sp. AD094]